MHEDMRTLLNAYIDAELHGMRLLQLQNHLASCEACRNELKELRRVSDLLRAAPALELSSVDRFIGNLTLNLPRRTLRDRPPKPGSLAWWLVPTGLMLAWFFVRTVYALSSVISAAEVTGLAGNGLTWLNGSGQEVAWFAALSSLFGGQTSSTLTMLNQVNVLGADLLSGLLWQALIVLLYWGWLAAWWLTRRPRPMKVTANPSQS